MKGLKRSLTRGNKQINPIVKDTIVVKNKTLQVDGATGVGFGSLVIGDFPAGNIMLLGAVSYFNFLTSAAGVTATFDGDYGIGTTPASDASITGADVDIIPSSALGAATATQSPTVRGVDATGAKAGVIFDNTDGSLELNLNLLIDDATISADDVNFTVNGYLVISYIILGDD